MAFTEVQTLVELDEVTVQHSVSYLVVDFQPCFLEEVEVLVVSGQYPLGSEDLTGQAAEEVVALVEVEVVSGQ